MDEDEIDPAHSLPEPETVNHLREFAVERIDEVMKRAFRIIRHSRNKAVTIECMALAFGWHSEISGITNSTDLARRHKCTKANVNKFVNQFRDVLPTGMQRLEGMPGQRTDESRQKFTQLRKEQCT